MYSLVGPSHSPLGLLALITGEPFGIFPLTILDCKIGVTFKTPFGRPVGASPSPDILMLYTSVDASNVAITNVNNVFILLAF